MERQTSLAGSSTYSSNVTSISRSTIPGLGYTSGKAFMLLGSTVVKGLDAIIIRRRLAQIETALSNKTSVNSDQSNAMHPLYLDLLELFRPAYNHSIRTRAFRLIMKKVGRMDFEELAAAVAEFPVSESLILIETMLTSLRLSNYFPLTSAVAFNAPTLVEIQAYDAQTPAGYAIFTAFILFLSMVMTLNPHPSFAKLLIQLNIVEFVTDTYPGMLDSNQPWPTALLPVELLLRTLLLNLDPINDIAYVVDIHRLLRGSSQSYQAVPRALLAASPQSPAELLKYIQFAVDESSSLLRSLRPWPRWNDNAIRLGLSVRKLPTSIFDGFLLFETEGGHERHTSTDIVLNEPS